MTGHMNQLNLKLQGKTNLISDYFVHVKAFRVKLVLLEGQVKVKNFAHFLCCEEFHAESKVEFPSFANEIISDLKNSFRSYLLTLMPKQMKSGSFIIHLTAMLKIFQLNFIWKLLISRQMTD